MDTKALLAIYNGILARCYKEDHYAYEFYGARGIKVCERWRESFDNFVKDIGIKPSNTHSLDRKDNDGDYEPDNIRWATKRQQTLNRRIPKNNKSGARGVYWHKGHKKWAASIRVSGRTILLGYFKEVTPAARAYDRAAAFYNGDEAQLNYPQLTLL